MTAKCKRHGHVTLPTHSFVCSCVHSFVCLFVRSFIHSCMHSFIYSIHFLHSLFVFLSLLLGYIVYLSVLLIQSYATVASLLSELYTLWSMLLVYNISFHWPANIKLGILERLARFLRIESCFHKDGTTGTMLHAAMTWSQQAAGWWHIHKKHNLCKQAQLTPPLTKIDITYTQLLQ